MQIAYRGRTAEDARRARDVLAAAGITAHIPDPDPSGGPHDGEHPEVVRVLVDNACVGPARRALQRWISEREEHAQPEE